MTWSLHGETAGEQSEQFHDFCDNISDLGLNGIEILPAVENMQNQNPVE